MQEAIRLRELEAESAAGRALSEPDKKWYWLRAGRENTRCRRARNSPFTQKKPTPLAPPEIKLGAMVGMYVTSVSIERSPSPTAGERPGRRRAALRMIRPPSALEPNSDPTFIDP